MQRSWLFIIPLSWLLAACHAAPGKAVRITGADDRAASTVTTAQGPVTGVRSSEGQAYLGIPYAQAPTGNLRWREPLPVHAWSTPRDASKLGNQCVQNLGPGAQQGKPSHWLVIGNEDCLNLNVYTPSGAKPGQGKPVMVWIYGGALVLGSNRQYDPSVLAQKQDVVTVAVNYRLAAMGFLSHPELRAQAGGAANLGLLDQQAALRWVRQNIASFGGDPDNVTLFGESAGAWSVCAQMVSPGAKGLFQRAILQSGPCTLHESTVPVAQADEDGARFASALGCPGKDAAACLRGLSQRKVDGAVAPSRGILGPHAWNFIAGDSVLPEAPRDAFASGHYAHVPVFIGTNHDEGQLFSFLLGKVGRMDDAAAVKVQMHDTFAAQADAVMKAYPANRYASPAAAYAAAVTDGIFACPSMVLAQALGAGTPTWAYEFSDPDAPFALSKKASLGAYHSSEIPYVFQARWVLGDPATFSPAQRTLSGRMQADWASFARTGRLDGEHVGEKGQGWRIYSPTPRPADAGSYAARHHCEFWSGIPL